jgi:RNA polymerase sigma-70 factor, ECF subfamily
MYANYLLARTDSGTESDVVARIAAGDRAAETEFVRQYARGVHVLVRRHCRPGDPVVEDIAQDVLARVLERLRAGAVRDAAALPAYIQTTIVHATSAEYRTRRPTEPVEAIDALMADGSPIEQLSASQLQQTLHSLLAELGVDRDRELLRRFYLDEHDKEDVCRELGIDADHFHRVAFRARERFRALLERAGIEGEIK